MRAHGDDAADVQLLRVHRRPRWTPSSALLAKAPTVAARRAIPGIEASRADIILAGALILEGVGQAFGVDRWTFSDYALREGVLLDTVARTSGGTGAAHELRDVARSSVRRLAERCDENPEHSTHVARLAARAVRRHAASCTGSATPSATTWRRRRCSPTSGW